MAGRPHDPPRARPAPTRPERGAPGEPESHAHPETGPESDAYARPHPEPELEPSPAAAAAARTGTRPARRGGIWHGQGPVLAVVAVGGAAGAALRYGAALLWPTAPGTFPWTTLGVNVTGCAAIGVLLVLLAEVWAAHRLVRPFLGTGVLGGFTTFSTYAVDIQRLAADGRLATAFGYLALTLAAALAAVWTAAVLTRRAIVRRQR